MDADRELVEFKILLPRKLADYLRSQEDLEQGTTIHHVVQEAINDLRYKDEVRRMKHAELRAEIQKGIDDFEAGRYTTCRTPEELEQFFEDIKARGRERLAQRQHVQDTEVVHPS